MPIVRGLAALRVLACMLCLLAPGPAGTVSRAFAATTIGSLSDPAPLRGQDKDESCGRGKATKDFGWKVVEFGVSTLKYLIGLFIIPVGLFLVVIGAMLQLVEAVAC